MDPFWIGMAVIVAGIVAFVVWWFLIRKEEDTPLLDILDEREKQAIAKFEFQWKAKENYTTMKEKALGADGDEISAASEADIKKLKSALWSRTMEAVQKIWLLQKEAKHVESGKQAGVLAAGEWEQYQQAVQDVNFEMEEIKQELEIVHPGEQSDNYFRKCSQTLAKLVQMKNQAYMHQVAEEKKRKEQREAQKNKEDEVKRQVKEAEKQKKQSVNEAERKAKIAERSFQRLMREESKKKKPAAPGQPIKRQSSKKKR